MDMLVKYFIVAIVGIVCFSGFALIMSTQMIPTQLEIDTVWDNIVELENSGLIQRQLTAGTSIQP